MKKIGSVFVCCFFLGLTFLVDRPLLTRAESFGQSGLVEVQPNVATKPVDPENPEKEVNPGEGPSTDGLLRIDYVSAFDFGSSEITKGKRNYQALAQQFFGETGPRGNYIQITDQQAESSGWTLQVKQEMQFTNSVIQNVEERELKGAVLSLDKGWANSSGTSEAPIVTRETIALNAIGSAYEVATAQRDSGKGVWTIAFGASSENSNNQAPTLTPLVDKEGNAVIDSIYKKPVYSNSAITLSIPESTAIYPVDYQTKITWLLAKLP